MGASRVVVHTNLNLAESVFKVFSILLHAGFSIEALGVEQVDICYRIIQECRQSNGGLVGFGRAPSPSIIES